MGTLALAGFAVQAVGQLVSIFSSIGGGCGSACTAAAHYDEVIQAAAEDIFKVYEAGMLNGSDTLTLFQALGQAAGEMATQLSNQGDPKANTIVPTVSKNLNAKMAAVDVCKAVSKCLNLKTAEELYVKPHTPGWYNTSIIAGNNLATNLLQYGQLTAQIPYFEYSSSGMGTGGVIGASLQALGGVLGDVGKSNDGLSGILGSLFSGVSGPVNSSGGVLSEIVAVVQAGASDAEKLVSNFQSTVVSKFVDPIEQSIQSSEATGKAIEAALKEGIQGWLKVPTLLSDTLDQNTLAYKQSALLRNENATEVASKLLVPGIGDKVAASLGDLAEKVKGLGSFAGQNLDDFPVEHLNTFFTENGLQDALGIAKKIFAGAGVTGASLIPTFGYMLFLVFVCIDLSKTALQAADQTEKATFPINLLSPSELVAATLRGYVNSKQAEQEARAQGFDASRFATMLELGKKLLDPQTALQAYFRGIISKADFAAEMQRQQFDDPRINTLIEVAQYLPDPSTAVDWYLRGVVSIEQVSRVLAAQGFTPQDVQAQLEVALRPAPYADVVRATGRQAALAKGFLGNTLSEGPPDAVSQSARVNHLDKHAAELGWLLHWKSLDMMTWTQAYYRSLISKEYLGEAMTDQNMPLEMLDVQIEANRPLISYFFIPTMLAAGVFDDAQATSLLKQYGLSQENIDLSIKYANFKALGKAQEGNRAYSQLTTSNLTQAMEDGVITAAEFEQALIEHGYNPENAIILRELTEAKAELKSRAQTLTDLVDEFKAGMLTEQAVLDTLGAQGYSAGEIAKARISMDRAKVVNKKMPTEAQLNKMLKDAVIDANTWTAAMLQLGYDPNWLPYIQQII